MRLISRDERGSEPASRHTPQYFNERQSHLRGIKDGWYAMDGDGSLAFGPFSNRETCLTRISQLAVWIRSSGTRERPI